MKKNLLARKPVALITGGAGGIGYAAALAMAEKGFDIALVDLHFKETKNRILKELDAFGIKPLLIQEDISDINTHHSILDRVLEAFGGLHSFVSSAGVSVLNRGDITEVTPESYDRCQAVNTRAVFFLCQAVAKYFIGNPKTDFFRSIVVISSLNSMAVSVNRSEYCVSKSGVSMVVKLFADRLAKLGVGTYEIQPGIIETNMTKPSIKKYNHLISNGLAPFGRVGQPHEVGTAIAALACGYFPYTTGQAITVDGGIHMVRY